jgi:hypothetical protein
MSALRHWPIKYQSLYAYLADWCDYTHRQAKAEVERQMAKENGERALPIEVPTNRLAA